MLPRIASAGLPAALVLPGFGTCAFWQLGAVTFLGEKMDLRALPMAASSGGGLAALLCSCDVPPEHAVSHAFQLCQQHRLYERKLGLVGVWREIIRQWLNELLPADAHQRCRHIQLVVTDLPSLQPVRLHSFESKQDLVSAALASAHVPWLLDLNFAATHRGRHVVDGNFSYSWLGQRTSLLPPGWVLSDSGSHNQHAAKLPLAQVLSRFLAASRHVRASAGRAEYGQCAGRSRSHTLHSHSSHRGCQAASNHFCKSSSFTPLTASQPRKGQVRDRDRTEAASSSSSDDRGLQAHHLPADTPNPVTALVLDPREDQALQLHKSMQCFQLMDRAQAMAFVDMGYAYMEKLHQAGKLGGQQPTAGQQSRQGFPVMMGRKGHAQKQ